MFSHDPIDLARKWCHINVISFPCFRLGFLCRGGVNEIIGATRTIEGSVYWIALVVNWMQTLGSQPVMSKILPDYWD